MCFGRAEIEIRISGSVRTLNVPGTITNQDYIAVQWLWPGQRVLWNVKKEVEEELCQKSIFDHENLTSSFL